MQSGTIGPDQWNNNRDSTPTLYFGYYLHQPHHIIEWTIRTSVCGWVHSWWVAKHKFQRHNSGVPYNRISSRSEMGRTVITAQGNNL